MSLWDQFGVTFLLFLCRFGETFVVCLGRFCVLFDAMEHFLACLELLLGKVWVTLGVTLRVFGRL